MKSLPPSFDQSASMTYPTAKEIRDKLAGSADKGLFGGLKGSAGTWDKIVKAYEKQSERPDVVLYVLAFVPSCPRVGMHLQMFIWQKQATH